MTRARSFTATAVGTRRALTFIALVTAADLHAAEESSESGPRPKRPPVARAVPTTTIVRSHLEPSYFAFPLVYVPEDHSLDQLWFEANVAPHFLIARPEFPIAVSLTPKVVLRMYRENSAPVKTPSYMPRVTAFGILSKEFAGEPVFYGSLTLSHHSNGQSGVFHEADGSINHESGDFSTNYLEAAFHVAGGSPNEMWWVSPSIEWHPGFNQSMQLEGVYGFWRLHIAFTGLRRVVFDDKVTLRFTAIVDRLDVPGDSETTAVLRRFPLSVQYTAKLPGIDLGVYAGAYAGPDYYNVWFDRYVTTFQVGLSGDISPSAADE